MTVKLSSSTGQGECRNMDAESNGAISRRISRSACTDTLGRVSASSSVGRGERRKVEPSTCRRSAPSSGRGWGVGDVIPRFLGLRGLGSRLTFVAIIVPTSGAVSSPSSGVPLTPHDVYNNNNNNRRSGRLDDGNLLQFPTLKLRISLI
jgi:hypothetical protein